MPKRNYLQLLFILTVLSILLLTACGQESDVSPTPVSTVKALATVFMSPTANLEQVAATRAAISPTPVPPTATVIPTETPYVGLFIGEAEQERGFVEITSPLFGVNASNPDTVISVQQPTADASRCPVEIDVPFTVAWRSNAIVNQRMGCPIQSGFGFFGEVQVFEGGVMYYYPEFNAVWAIRPLLDDSRGRYDYMENPPDSSTVGLQAEVGLIVPDGLFADMWLAISGLPEEIGYAVTDVQQAPMGLQRFANGTFIHDVSAGQVYALVVDGTVLGPYLASESISATATPVVGVTPESTAESSIEVEATEETGS